MRGLVQRVTQAYVTIDAHEVARIGRGLVVLLGVGKEDVEADAEYLLTKTAIGFDQACLTLASPQGIILPLDSLI